MSEFGPPLPVYNESGFNGGENFDAFQMDCSTTWDVYGFFSTNQPIEGYIRIDGGSINLPPNQTQIPTTIFFDGSQLHYTFVSDIRTNDQETFWSTFQLFRSNRQALWNVRDTCRGTRPVAIQCRQFVYDRNPASAYLPYATLCRLQPSQINRLTSSAQGRSSSPIVLQTRELELRENGLIIQKTDGDILGKAAEINPAKYPSYQTQIEFLLRYAH